MLQSSYDHKKILQSVAETLTIKKLSAFFVESEILKKCCQASYRKFYLSVNLKLSFA